MYVHMDLLNQLSCSKKPAGLVMAMIRPKSQGIYRTTSMQRLLETQTFESISKDNTLSSMTLQSWTINGTTSYWLTQMVHLSTTRLMMLTIWRFHHSLHICSWSTLSALLLQMIRCVSKILCSFKHSHSFSCFVSLSALSFDSYVWSSMGLSSRPTSHTTISWGKLSSVSGRSCSKCWNLIF